MKVLQDPLMVDCLLTKRSRVSCDKDYVCMSDEVCAEHLKAFIVCGSGYSD